MFQFGKRRVMLLAALLLVMLLAALLLVMLLAAPLHAQDAVVYGVFFYSPTCRYCHEVINNHWGGIQAEFGDQLQVLFVDVSTAQGSQIMSAAISALRIPSNGVPLLVIGDQYFIGAVNIPQGAPVAIRAGLVAGGIGYPPIPGIERTFEQALGVEADAPASASGVQAAAPNAERAIFADPANVFALIVLFGLAGSLVALAAALWRGLRLHKRDLLRALDVRFGRVLLIIGGLIGLGLAATLLLGSGEDTLTLVLSTAVLTIFGIVTLNLLNTPALSQASRWLIPLIIVAGVLVAGYLAYVETAVVEATCGVLGDCNAVQTSIYAQIAGIPVGVIGLVGYSIMLVVWLVAQSDRRPQAGALLLVLAAAGVGFSLYLTFLEPFVIGATCVWCLTSAVIMTMLLWLALPITGWTQPLTPARARHARSN